MPRPQGLSSRTPASRKRAKHRHSVVQSVPEDNVTAPSRNTPIGEPFLDVDSLDARQGGASIQRSTAAESSASAVVERIANSDESSGETENEEPVEAIARGRVSRKVVVYEIPTTVRFVIHKMRPGKPSKKEETMQYDCVGFRDLDYHAIVQRLDEFESEWSEKTKGSWTLLRQIGLFPASQLGVPLGRFRDNSDWVPLVKDFERDTARTGLPYSFVVRNIYVVGPARALQLPTPSLSASESVRRDGVALSSSIGVMERPAGSQASSLPNRRPDLRASISPSPMPFEGVSNPAEYDEELDDLFDDSFETPTPHETTTSQRIGLLTPNDREISKTMSEIEKFHQCDTCRAGYCYAPLPNKKHCDISPGSKHLWTRAILADRATLKKPPDDCREWIQWQKDIEGSLVRPPLHGPGTVMPQSPYSAPVIHFHGLGNAIGGVNLPSPGRQATEPHSVPAQPNLQASSVVGSEEDEEELLRDWFEYTLARHKVLSGIVFDEIKEKLDASAMSYHAVRDWLKEDSPELWEKLVPYGIQQGLARWMCREHRRWKKQRPS